MVRSPYPHARIVGIDSARAQAMPGVLGVFTGADCAADKLDADPARSGAQDEIRHEAARAAAAARCSSDRTLLLPADKARHVGEAVAMVVAETKAQAMDAAEAVEVAIRGTALRRCIPKTRCSPARPRSGTRCRTTSRWKPSSAMRRRRIAAFAARRHIVTKDFHIGRVTGVPLEPRAALGHYDAATGRYTLYAGSGGAVRQKSELSTVLGVPPESCACCSHDVGGNFGTRNRVFVEFGLVLWAARKLGRPVKYTATRSEAFLSDYQGRDLVTKVELALDADTDSSACAPPTSATSARAAYRCRRSARDPA